LLEIGASADDGGDRKSTIKALAIYASEHYPNASYGVYPVESDSKVAVVIVANKYSPKNFW
jgi:capping protein (actin filament) muscle Z-line, alpha